MILGLLMVLAGAPDGVPPHAVAPDTVALAPVGGRAADTVALTPGMVITRSVVIRPGPYRLRPPPGDSVVVRIRGDGIDVDLSGAQLVGAPYDAPPDAGDGIGILVEGGRDVTIRRATVRGFKVGILARGVAGLRILDSDLSYNWKPRLWSRAGHESLADWLSFHHNEKDEWLRFGGALFLIDVTGGEILRNRAYQGMNGLMLVRSSGLTVAGNDFSFLSGLGIGLYRASDNRILHNRADYCVRGYHHGSYERGQDSAALLLYEQSTGNVVAYNSFTHSGDGIFLWAGQSTMDSGQGGANDNLFFGNDVSFAVANGIEATFSRNRIIGNLAEGSRYGVWAGYSHDTEIRGNRLLRNRTGVAIEHGQDNRIIGNDFEGDSVAIQLWWKALEPSDWGYPKQRDTRSMRYSIEANRFLGNRVALALSATSAAVLKRNMYFGVDTLFRLEGSNPGFVRDARASGMAAMPLTPWTPNLRDTAAPPPLPNALDALAASNPRRGMASILVDEWGPYDWKAPRVWPASLADSATVRAPTRHVVLGPPGAWSMVSARGASLDRPAGQVGDTITITPAAGPVVDYDIEFEYRGEAVVAADGAMGRAGDPYRFRARRFVAPIDWRIEIFAWDSVSDPRASPGRSEAPAGAVPVAVRADSVLDVLWSRPRWQGVPAERWRMVATGTVEVPAAGEYDVVTISDDGVRVWVDDQLVIDHWTAHESQVDRAPIAAGQRRLRLEYYQVDGWVEVRAEVVPRSGARSR